MTDLRFVAATEFKSGDEVVLADGPHPGTSGVFLNLRPDRGWAEIRERNGVVRAHPVIWLRRAELSLGAAA